MQVTPRPTAGAPDGSGDAMLRGSRAGQSDEGTGVLIVDDHRAFAELLAAALRGQQGIRVVGTANSADSAVQMTAAERPDVVVMDIQLGSQDGLQAVRRIRELDPGVLVVVVSAHTDPGWVARAAAAGANGYAPKSGSLDELLMVLRQARMGQLFVAPSLRRHPVAEPQVPGRAALTAREAEVLCLLAAGAGPAEIARILGMSVHTCRGHVKAIYAKLEVRSQLEALAAARRRGLLANADDQTG